MTQQLCLFDDKTLAGPLEEPKPLRERFHAHFGWGDRKWFLTRKDLEAHLRQEFGPVKRITDTNRQYDYAYMTSKGGIVARVQEGSRPR